MNQESAGGTVTLIIAFVVGAIVAGYVKEWMKSDQPVAQQQPQQLDPPPRYDSIYKPAYPGTGFSTPSMTNAFDASAKNPRSTLSSTESVSPLRRYSADNAASADSLSTAPSDDRYRMGKPASESEHAQATGGLKLKFGLAAQSRNDPLFGVSPDSKSAETEFSTRLGRATVSGIGDAQIKPSLSSTKLINESITALQALTKKNAEPASKSTFFVAFELNEAGLRLPAVMQAIKDRGGVRLMSGLWQFEGATQSFAEHKNALTEAFRQGAPVATTDEQVTIHDAANLNDKLFLLGEGLHVSYVCSEGKDRIFTP